jgi:hypothetical protein
MFFMRKKSRNKTKFKKKLKAIEIIISIMQSRVLMLVVARLFEIFPAMYEAQNLITVFSKPATVPCSGQDSSTARIFMLKTKTKLHGLSPQAKYTDRMSDRRLSTKLVPTLADRGCRVVSATIPPQSSISVF